MPLPTVCRYVSRAAPWLVALTVLAGCAAPPLKPAPVSVSQSTARIRSFELSGRIAVKQAETGHYGNIRWQRNGSMHHIDLLSPLGQVATRILRDGHGYQLTTSDQRVFQAEHGEALMRAVLGYALPIEGLEFWVLGQPAPASPAQQQWSSEGYLARLHQDGWDIEYANYTQVEGMALPGRLVLKRGDLEVKLAIDHWRLGGVADSNPPERMAVPEGGK